MPRLVSESDTAFSQGDSRVIPRLVREIRERLESDVAISFGEWYHVSFRAAFNLVREMCNDAEFPPYVYTQHL